VATKPKMKVKVQVSSTKGSAEEQERMGSVRKSVVFLAIVAVIYMAYLVLSGQFGGSWRPWAP
jgi:hypothetical protein